MAASSSPPHVFEYDVFLSFRGKDTRNGFTSHLRQALVDMKINTYTDYKLESGDEIGPALLKAIEQSKISLIIFSTNYASSSWCLDELAHIVQCRELYQQYVIPIFYRIYPSQVRHQTESYAAAFSKHEERFKESIVLKWRCALKTAANLSGFGSHTFRDECELIKAAIQAILKKLNRECSSELKGLVGIESRIQQIESLLCIDAEDVGVRTVGIWGMGGIGKTTLADAVFNRFSSKFEDSCFLANVREESEKCGLYRLRDKLLQKLLKDETLEIHTPSIGSTYHKIRLSSKVLVVLDDVNDVSQLEFLVGDQVQFGLGSRIIITTRDQHQIREMQRLRKAADHDVKIYNMELLNKVEATELFHLNDSEEMSLGADYVGLISRVVDYAAGIPLALKIWGSLFRRCKSKHERDSFLEKLKEFPDEKLQKVHMISYDVLGKNEKEIFLDIACFHKNKEIHDVKRELDACGLFADIGIQFLIDMSLISIKTRLVDRWMHDEQEIETDDVEEIFLTKKIVQEIWMHDVVQEMGWAIVYKECPEDPGKRSRLYTPEDVHRVLENNTGTEQIQRMALNESTCRSIKLPLRVFKSMHNLKLLKVYGDIYGTAGDYKVSFNLRVPESLPYSLKILWWFQYPFKSLPPKFSPDNLVELSMRGSQLQRLWNEGQSPRNLKSIDLRGSKELFEVPDLSKSVNIERIDLEGCTGLVAIPSYFENLVKLTYLNLRWCSNLRILFEMPHNIEFLLLTCSVIEELPTSVWSLEKLVELDIEFCNGSENCDFWELNSVTYFQNKRWIRWHSPTECRPRLVSHHNNSSKLKFIEQFLGCSSIENSLELLEPVECMEDLHLIRTDIKQVPSLIDNLVGLKRLSLDECRSLVSIPNTIYNLKLLECLEVNGSCRLKKFPAPCSVILWSSMRELSFVCCESLEEVPDCIFSLTSLQKLSLSGSMIKSIPPTIKQASELRYLHLQNCKFLESLPQLPCLVKYLDASGCTKLRTVSWSETALTQGELNLFPPCSVILWSSMCELSFACCESLEEIPDCIFSLTSLQKLSLSGSMIKSIPPTIKQASGLRDLDLNNCKCVESLPELPCLVKYLDASGCTKLRTVSWSEAALTEGLDQICEFNLLPPCSVILWSSMCELSFARCESLEEIPDCIFSLTSLQKLSLNGSMIKSIPPTIKQASELRYLHLQNCKFLVSLPQLPCLVKYLDASGCTKLRTVSRSETALTQGLDQISGEEHHLFCKCARLDDKARSNIMHDVRLKIMRTATAWHRFRYECPSVTAVCWGYEIPRWFRYQTQGCSMEITLPPNWCDEANFLGLALCAVVMVDNQGSLMCTCDSIFKTIDAESHHVYRSSFTWNHNALLDTDIENSDHVVVWYDNLGQRPISFCNATQASFDFSQLSCGRVKRCGVCFLYAQGQGHVEAGRKRDFSEFSRF